MSIKRIIPSDTSSSSTWINIFDFTDQYFNEEHSVTETLTDTDIYTDELAKFTKLAGKDIKIMHLNINSLFLKIDEIHAILDTKEFDMVFLNETKLDSFIPNTKVCHHGYNIQRRDRDYSDSIGLGKKGGGLIVYTKKYLNCSISISNNFEAIHVKLLTSKKNVNFLACYKSPSIHNTDCIHFLDSYISSIDPAEPLFIVGDLNMNTNSQNGNELVSFIKDNNLDNIVIQPTRVRTCFYKNRSKMKNTSATHIDVILHNKLLTNKTEVIGCPFSDHKFVVASIKLNLVEPLPTTIWSRNLSEDKLLLIEKELTKMDYSAMDCISTVNEKWLFMKTKIISIIDKISPIKQIKLKNKERYPWNDLELYKVKSFRDISYSKAKKSQNENDWEIYKTARKEFQKLNRSKILEYFSDKNLTHFKNSKKFWNFYKSSVKMKSDQMTMEGPNLVQVNGESESNPEKIATSFNKFFTSIKSLSLSSKEDSHEFIVNHLNDLKKKMK